MTGVIDTIVQKLVPKGEDKESISFEPLSPVALASPGFGEKKKEEPYKEKTSLVSPGYKGQTDYSN